MASGSQNLLLREIVFSDVNVTFTPHPVTGKLPVLKNAQAVKRAVRNLILTNFGERAYDPLYGGNVRALLFENTDDPLLRDRIRRDIKGAINQYEKRAEVLSVDVDVKADSNALVIKIQFQIVNDRFPIDLEVAIQRVR